MNTMLAARAHQGAAELRLEQVPIAELGPREVRVRVAAAGIAPGMMKLLEKGLFKHLPSTPGHEIAGVVESIGSDVDPAWVGRRVRVHPMLSCGECDYCRTDRQQMCSECAMIGHAAFGTGPLALYARYHDGGLAEFARAPVDLLDVLPDPVSFEVGAKVHDLANAVRALKCSALPASGRLVVTAATGTMGTATIKLARFFGARELVLVARSRERLEAVRGMAGELPVSLVPLEELGADWETAQGLTRRLREIWPSGADGVLDYFPSGPGTGQAMAALALGGTLVHMGGNPSPVTWPIARIMQSCWRIVGTRACTRSDTDAVLQLLATGELQAEDLITHRFPLSRVNAALTAMMDRSEPMWMTVVQPGA
ncbi:alcohol dehydrogenase catalytic domain-containing protein [Ramlibacter sp. AW1]|uniref:Alcohol dehydrogenase catalytic domain-containing protein n=1 Tax=Ramlibacter aurantiacus TaxID=2801330 RepID=A0A937D0P7_9BURK|nr:alcohol dehydrogenase catalytic domain-containing protein [Ramlibacter aurantiacus]MBL0419659.1 alcohol dehydrogenase catalytic domain-containing protein [Ramlibacter aurantiacus]